jgi:hypothetical protein
MERRTSSPGRPRGFVPIGVFFAFGATMAAYAAVTLLIPGTFLDTLWALNKHGHEQLAGLGKIAALPFSILSIALCCAAIGWFHRRYWGWFLGTSIIAINMAGDVVNLAIGEHLKGAVGVVTAGLLLIYMTRPSVRDYFRQEL